MEDINCWESKFTPCYYSDRLLNKLLELNNILNVQVDIVQIKKAIYYTRKYHGDQRRNSGEPYYSHPIEVAYMLSDHLFSTDSIVVAILHDVIEDTTLTKEMIEVIFSEKVASKVDDLTRIKLHGKISSAEMIESLYILGKHDVLMIKIFDRIHNMQTIGVKSPEKIKKIVHETTSTFLALATHFDSLDIEKKTTDLCLLKSKNNQSSFYKQKKFSFF